jgi:hypothetical protein
MYPLYVSGLIGPGDRKSIQPMAELYLAAFDAEAQAAVEVDGNNTDGGSADDGRLRPDRKPPKVISRSDPQSAWTGKANKRVLFGYGLNYLIEIKHAVIIDVEATSARTYDAARISPRAGSCAM